MKLITTKEMLENKFNEIVLNLFLQEETKDDQFLISIAYHHKPTIVWLKRFTKNGMLSKASYPYLFFNTISYSWSNGYNDFSFPNRFLEQPGVANFLSTLSPTPRQVKPMDFPRRLWDEIAGVDNNLIPKQ